MGVGMYRVQVLVEEAVGGQYIAKGFVVGQLTVTTEDGLNSTAPVCTPVLINCPERTRWWLGATCVPSFLLWKLNHRTGTGYLDIQALVVCAHRGQTTEEQRDPKRHNCPCAVS
jgi:hypothetical protein